MKGSRAMTFRCRTSVAGSGGRRMGRLAAPKVVPKGRGEPFGAGVLLRRAGRRMGLGSRLVGRFGHVRIKASKSFREQARFRASPPPVVWLYGRFLRTGRRSSVVERILGKAEVVGSIPPGGTI